MRVAGGTGDSASSHQAGLPVRKETRTAPWSHSPDGGLHLALVLLVVVQLGEQGEKHLDPTDGVNGAVDGVCHDGFHILWSGTHTHTHASARKHTRTQ